MFDVYSGISKRSKRHNRFRIPTTPEMAASVDVIFKTVAEGWLKRKLSHVPFEIKEVVTCEQSNRITERSCSFVLTVHFMDIVPYTDRLPVRIDWISFVAVCNDFGHKGYLSIEVLHSHCQAEVGEAVSKFGWEMGDIHYDYLVVSGEDSPYASLIIRSKVEKIDRRRTFEEEMHYRPSRRLYYEKVALQVNRRGFMRRAAC